MKWHPRLSLLVGRLYGRWQSGWYPSAVQGSPATSSLVIRARYEAGLIIEHNSTSVSKIPFWMCPTPLQTACSYTEVNSSQHNGCHELSSLSLSCLLMVLVVTEVPVVYRIAAQGISRHVFIGHWDQFKAGHHWRQCYSSQWDSRSNVPDTSANGLVSVQNSMELVQRVPWAQPSFSERLINGSCSHWITSCT